MTYEFVTLRIRKIANGYVTSAEVGARTEGYREAEVPESFSPNIQDATGRLIEIINDADKIVASAKPGMEF
jgi:hypothetical protein